MNNYDHVPDFLEPGEWAIRDNSKGDAERYYGIDNTLGYILTCDDDLIYPENYVKYMIYGVDKYNAACTLHGKTYKRPFEAFNVTMCKYRCLDDVFGDGKIDVGGTGVMAWHTDFLKVRYDDFQSKNMADVWFSKICHEQGVDIMCLEHKRGHLVYQGPSETIWIEEKKKGFVEQTRILKTFL